jgi:hypothetical protein
MPGHRADAICQYFKRDFKQGIDLDRLAELLGHPQWINADTVSTISHLKGEIPVAWNPGETVFAIRLSPEDRDDSRVLYLRLSRPIGVEAFVQTMRGSRDAASTPQAAGTRVLEGACSD